MSKIDCTRFECIMDRLLTTEEEPSSRDVAFINSHGSHCLACSLEKSVIDTLEDARHFDLTGDLGNADIEFKARQLLSLNKEKHQLRYRSVGFAFAAVTGLAVLIAGIFVLFHGARTSQSSFAKSVAAEDRDLTLPALTLIGGQAKTMDRREFQSGGVPLLLGKTVRTGEGRATLQFDNGTRAVIHSETRLTLVESTKEMTRFKLDRGSAAFQVAKQEGGRFFEVETAQGTLRVLGTVFGVSCEDGCCEIEVAEGRVGFSSPARLDVLIEQGQRLNTCTGMRDLFQSEEKDLLERLVSEENVGGLNLQDDEDQGVWTVTRGAPEGQEREPGAQDGISSLAKKTKKDSARALRKRENVEVTVRELLDRVRQSRTNKDWSGVQAAYQRLIELHPDTPEAKTCLVPMGKVQLEHLGQARQALGTFRRYIRSGPSGSLGEEAQWGIILALRRLGETAKERAALRRFLRNYPDSLYAPWVGERLEKLNEI